MGLTTLAYLYLTVWTEVSPFLSASEVFRMVVWCHRGKCDVPKYHSILAEVGIFSRPRPFRLVEAGLQTRICFLIVPTYRTNVLSRYFALMLKADYKDTASQFTKTRIENPKKVLEKEAYIKTSLL